MAPCNGCVSPNGLHIGPTWPHAWLFAEKTRHKSPAPVRQWAMWPMQGHACIGPLGGFLAPKWHHAMGMLFSMGYMLAQRGHIMIRTRFVGVVRISYVRRTYDRTTVGRRPLSQRPYVRHFSPNVVRRAARRTTAVRHTDVCRTQSYVAQSHSNGWVATHWIRYWWRGC